MTLDKLPLGKAATIEAVSGEGALRRHFLNMGLTPGTRVTLRKTAPMGDPIELELRGYELTLRLEDAKNIQIGEPGEPGEAPAAPRAAIPPIPHPGHGEKSARPWRRTRPWCSRWRATRTAARPPCSTSSPAQTSMWATSPA